MIRHITLAIGILLSNFLHGQITLDSVRQPQYSYMYDTSLRINNFSPFFSLHVDSSLSYQFLINKNPKNYYWYLKEAPVGVKIDKDDGILTFKSNKSLFLSGRLKYDKEYPIRFGVQNLTNPLDKLDTTLRITFYSTDIVYPRIKPSVVSPVTITEGTRLSFNVICQNGNFPIEKILLSSDISIGNFKLPKTCDDNFEWIPGYDFVNEKDDKKEKVVNLVFIGSTNFNFSDTAKIKVIVKDGLNFDIATADYKSVEGNVKKWISTLKATFIQLDKKIKRTKTWRSGFDITTASTTLTGTVLATTAEKDDTKQQNIGKILPSIGVVAMPVKEASVPQKSTEQNQATLLRANFKRLEYVLFENQLAGDRDPLIAEKTETLKKELRQSQNQLADVPTDIFDNMSDEERDRYINSRKVQKKYRLK